MKTRFGTRLLGLTLIAAIVLMTLVAGVAASPWAGDSIFSALLRGSNEVPIVVTNASGIAGVRFTASGSQLHYTVITRGVVNITASHIHCAAKGVNGPVGVTFEPQVPLMSGVVTAPDVNNRCGWTTLDDVFNALVAGNAYVNVHTLSNPAGLIRGQGFALQLP